MKTKLNFIFLSALLAATVGSIHASGQASRSATPSPKRPAASKASSVNAYKLIGIKVTGTDRYNDQEILAASGLELGQNVGEGDFKEAVRRLGDTGMFTDVAYSFAFSDAGTKLELQLTDTDSKKLVPVVFENFVWFTDAELLGELRKRVPLFKLVLPATGTLPDRMSDSLQALLSEKQLPGHVDYLRQAKQEGGDLIGIGYRVSNVEIEIRNCEFPGASPEQAEALAAVARKVTGAPYERSSLAAIARVDFLPVYLKRGYLKAEFAPSEAKVVPKPSQEATLADVAVDAILPVTPGKVYSTSAVMWQGNAALKTDELQALLHMPVGEPANAVRLITDLESAGRLYRSHGYMAAQVASEAAIDDAKGTVAYTLKVVEGDQYKMGDLDVVGLDTQATARLVGAWTLREGDPYNADYAKKFLEAANRLLPVGVAWDIATHEAVNAKDKTVDVTLRFRPR
jgi:outer membrane protein insertion porin family